jgi:hypothetical protein
MFLETVRSQEYKVCESSTLSDSMVAETWAMLMSSQLTLSTALPTIFIPETPPKEIRQKTLLFLQPRRGAA